MRKIHVYADELGDAGPYSEHSPIYSLSLLFLDEISDRKKPPDIEKRHPEMWRRSLHPLWKSHPRGGTLRGRSAGG